MQFSKQFSPLAAEANYPNMSKAAAKFVAEIWAYLPSDATSFMAYRQGPRWIEQPITGDRRLAAQRFIEDHQAKAGDLYFCPNGFEGHSRKSSNALRTCLAWCDVDDGDPKAFQPRPNILWESSAGRYQSIWIWDEAIDPHVAELISKTLLQYGGDKGGWSITKMLRVPGTINHKPERNRDRVRLLRFDPKPQSVPNFSIDPVRSWTSGDVDEFDPARFEASAVLRRYRRKVSLFARTLMEAKQVIYPDRSEAIYVIVSELIGAGAENDEIGCILLSNPHFLEKHGDDWAMAEREIVTIRAKLGDDR